MPQIWPHELIRELLAQAETSGSASARLESAEEAERFRYAIYNFRRSNNLGTDLTITIDECEVTITRTERPKVELT